jgi:shikimate kinase
MSKPRVSVRLHTDGFRTPKHGLDKGQAYMKIFLIGFMGSGKTHWGRLLASRLNLPFYDLDSVITQQENKTISDIFAEKGEEYFRYKEKEVMESLVTSQVEFIMSSGGGTPCFFNNIEFMKKNGRVIWLNTSIDILQKRLLKERLSRPLIRNINEAELKAYIIRKLSERKIYYEQADVMVNEEAILLEPLVELLKDE